MCLPGYVRTSPIVFQYTLIRWGVSFFKRPLSFSKPNQQKHLERTLHINSLYDNLDPGSHGIARTNIIRWQILGSSLPQIKTCMKCPKGCHQKLPLRLGHTTGRLNFALQARRYQIKSPELIEGNSVSREIFSRGSCWCQWKPLSQIRNYQNTAVVLQLWLHVLRSFRSHKTTPSFPDVAANKFLTVTLH